MKTLYIERSTGESRSGDWTEKLDLSERPDRIVVGIGPGSFAGIRAALAFAQGYALGSGCSVFGLPSSCALAEPSRKVAVVGDARRGKFWVALYDGYSQIGDVFQVGEDGLSGAVGEDFEVVTPDAARIDGLLRRIFGERYEGGRTPTEEGLRAFAEANPSILKPEPLPIYLNPAVRD
jgi:tRNA threonylcarbamoyl adenosine modification protein YeaZ